MTRFRPSSLGLAALTLAFVACSSTRHVSSTKGPPAEASSGQAASGPRPSVPELTGREICALAPTIRAAGRPGAKIVTPLDPHCPDDNGFCDSVDKSPNPKDACFVANDNIRRAERESRSARPDLDARVSSPWDGVRAPKYLDRIDAHLHLTPEEHAKLAQNHFVVLDRLPYRNYAAAFHDVFQEQLPLFVGVDPILHAVFRGTELALENIERERLISALMTMLKKLRTALAQSAGALDSDTRSDLDVYLGVAAHLAPTKGDAARDLVDAAGKPSPKLSALRGQEARDNAVTIARFVESIDHESGLEKVELFGRQRMVDFSQFTPRGHYVDASGWRQPSIGDYFRAMMWLSRIEFNLVSRSSRSSHPGPAPDPSETPREARDAVALSELLQRSGAAAELAEMDRVYTAFAGTREDVSPAKLAELARTHGFRASDRDVAPKLKAAIGEGFERKARTHFTPEGAPRLPAIFTLIGPRIVPDVAPLGRVVHDQVEGRKYLGAADVAYLLGHDRARKYITDFDAHPTLPEAFARARAELAAGAAASHDVYGSWLRSILALGKPASGVVPSFAKTDAYLDHRMSSALVGFGQLRHAYVLLAAQGYDAYGCQIPDGYVDPLPAVYDALLAHVRAMRAAAGAKGWAGLERVLGVLANIAHAETSGRVLSDPERRWLGMVSEHIPNGGYTSTGEPPKWTGWYFDMFEDREYGAASSTSFIADYVTLTNAGEVAYLGAEGPRLAVFVVDTNGEPRAMVGPVAKGFEAHAPIAGRLDDENVFAADAKRVAPWRASYAVPPREPALDLEGSAIRCGDPQIAPVDPFAMSPTNAPKAATNFEWRVGLRSSRALGKTRVVLLDHHGDPLTNELVFDFTGDGKWQVGVFDLPPDIASSRLGPSAIHVHVDDLARSGMGVGPFDLSTSPSVFQGKTNDPEGTMPMRPEGMGIDVGVPAAPAGDAGP